MDLDKLTNELQLKLQADENRKVLVDLATSNNSEQLIEDLMSSDIPTQLRAFVVSQAKSELIRVIQLTDALNSLEDTFIKRALDDKDGMDMKSLGETMNIIIRSLNRSMSLIDKITNDQDLKLIIDQSTKVYNAPNAAVNILTNQRSREKVRNIADQLFSVLKQDPSEIVRADPIDPGSTMVDAEYEVVDDDDE